MIFGSRPARDADGELVSEINIDGVLEPGSAVDDVCEGEKVNLTTIPENGWN